jgi:hypothetical protein
MDGRGARRSSVGMKPFAVCFGLLLGIVSVPAQSIANPIAALKDHITGAAALTAAQIVTQGNLIQTDIRQVGADSDDEVLINATDVSTLRWARVTV